MKKLIVAAAIFVAAITTAEARPRHHHHHHRQRVERTQEAPRGFFGNFFGGVPQTSDSRPRDCYGIAWCGCWLRHQLGIDDKSLNLASNWHRWGRRVPGPVVGAVVRFVHHVGIVVGVTESGDPIVKSGNHNHAVATAVYPKRRVIEYRVATQ